MAEFEFSPEKALAATAFLTQQSGETMYTILKMVYIADRMHLDRYGRPITGDSFYALPEGACPTRIYDSMKALRGDDAINHLPGGNALLRVDAKTHDVEVTGMPDMSELSASDIECLEETVSILKKRGRWHVRDMAHDAAWKNTAQNSQMPFVEIARTLDAGETLSKHLANRL